MAKLVSVVVNNRQYDVDALNELNAVRIPAPTVAFGDFAERDEGAHRLLLGMRLSAPGRARRCRRRAA